MKIKYFSDDGKEFETKEECVRYEQSMIPKMYNQRFERVHDFDQAVYFVIMNEVERNWFMEEDKKMSGEYKLKCDYDYPETFGVWMYDMNQECYTTLYDMSKRYARIKDTIMEMGLYN